MLVEKTVIVDLVNLDPDPLGSDLPRGIQIVNCELSIKNQHEFMDRIFIDLEYACTISHLPGANTIKLLTPFY